MSGAEKIIAINIDPDASIFKIAHTAMIGDVCEIIPELLDTLAKGDKTHV